MDEDLIHERSELKFILPGEETDAIIARVTPSGAQTGRITTVYFDRPDGLLARGALRFPEANLKIRLREYLTGDGRPCSPFVWIEIKEREGRISLKSRFQLHKRLVASFLRDEVELGIILTCQGPSVEPQEAIDAVNRIREVAGGPLVPAGAVSYRRTALQSSAPQARLTIDRDIAYHLATPDLYQRHPVLDRAALGPVAWREPSGIVELKFRGSEPPRWCAAPLRGAEPQEYSKFLVLARLALEGAAVA